MLTPGNLTETETGITDPGRKAGCICKGRKMKKTGKNNQKMQAMKNDFEKRFHSPGWGEDVRAIRN